MEKDLWFRERLMRWHREENNRNLPWKGEKDPYRIWLSEIILQQTRSAQGLPYYERFVAAYPRIRDLAAAPDEEVFRHWQGLGYYSRCRNLLHTARHIANDLAGHFPDKYEAIRALKGVGEYTAAAIASFAYGLPYAVVDGNVYRVLARYFGIAIPTDSTAGKKHFAALAQGLLDTNDPGEYNSAIMDHGATICLPKLPRCPECPVRERCTAYAEGLTSAYPVRGPKGKLKERYLHYIVAQHKGKVFIQKRTEGIWKDLYETVLVESDRPLDTRSPEIRNAAGKPGKAVSIEYGGELTHILTHQRLFIRFFIAEIQFGETEYRADGLWVPFKDLNMWPFPQPLVVFFEKNFYF